jgi:histone H3/H4
MEAMSVQQLRDLAKQVDPTVEIDDDVANVSAPPLVIAAPSSPAPRTGAARAHRELPCCGGRPRCPPRARARALQVLLDLADQFVEEVTQVSCKLAKHRGGEQLEPRDLKLCLEKNWDIRVPGYALLSDNFKGGAKRPGPTDAHKQRAEKVRKTANQ